jgi:hypothetical protein
VRPEKLALQFLKMVGQRGVYRIVAIGVQETKKWAYFTSILGHYQAKTGQKRPKKG